MALFNNKQNDSKRRTRLVATGKRVKGSWIMETALPAKTRQSNRREQILVTENRRVRTLH